MTLNLSNAVSTAQQLLTYTVEAPNFSDKVDVILVAEMIEKIGTFAEKYKEVNRLTANVATYSTNKKERHYSQCASYLFRICKSVVKVTCVNLRKSRPLIRDERQLFKSFAPEEV